MSQELRSLWLMKPAMLAASVVLTTSAIGGVSGSAIANESATSVEELSESELSVDRSTAILEQIHEYNPLNLSQGGNEPLDQVNFVNQLRDVKPTDWAFTALQNLAQRYNCLLAYPDGTYRGNRAMTRYEFAAGLDACLNEIQRQLAQIDVGVADSDLDTLARLQEEFAGELTILRRQVDAIEVRTAELEANQFSTTTKLVGESIFTLGNAFGENVDSQVVFNHRSRLNFITSFTGKDSLITRLEFGNIGPSFRGQTGTNEGRYAFDGAGGNIIRLNRLHYNFPVSSSLKASIFANAGGHHFYAPTLNPFEAGGGGGGALSRFGERNPIFRKHLGGRGIGFKYQLNPNVLASFGYLANEAGSPTAGNGLFNGNYSALGQLVFGSKFKIGLTYIHGYHGENNSRFALGGTGTGLGNLNLSSIPGVDNTPVSSNSYGLQTTLPISPNLILGGWVGKTSARLIGLGDADIWNYAVTVALPDLGRKGSMGGLIVGAEPYLTDLDVPGDPNFADDIPWHVEGFYQYKMSKNIAITPGVIWLLSPNQNSDNNDVVIGTLRTTFTF